MRACIAGPHSQACFALRDIDLSKCESRQASAGLLSYLAFKGLGVGPDPSAGQAGSFRYCFYYDIRQAESDPVCQAALAHLGEQSQFVRVLGSYPAESRLLGPVREQLDVAATEHPAPQSAQLSDLTDRGERTV